MAAPAAAQILPGFSAFLRACRSHRKVLKPAGNKCKDNEEVACTAGIRPADKAAVSRGESALRNNTAACL